MSVEDIETGVEDIINRWDNKQDNPSSTLDEEDALNMGILQPEEEGKNTEDTQTSEYTETEAPEKQYEKLGAWDTTKDVAQSVGVEALHFFQPKNSETQYESKTHFGENMKYIYRYGVGTAAFLSSFLYGGGEVATVGAIAKGAAVAKGATQAVASADKIIQFGKGLQALVKSKQLVNTTKMGLEAAHAGKSVKAALVAGNAINASVDGLVAGALADFTLYRPEENEGHLADMFGDTNNPLLSFLQTKETDGAFVSRLKNVVDGIVVGIPFGGAIGGAVAGAALTPSARKLARSLHTLANAQTADEAGKALINTTSAKIELENVAKTMDLVQAVDDLRNEAEQTGQEVSQLIIDRMPTEKIEEAKEIAKVREAGDNIFPHEDGTWSIRIEKWDDAYKVSPEEYKRQLSAMDKENGEDYAGDTAINHQDAAVKQTWTDRGWMGENDNLIKTTEKGTVRGNRTLANNIVKNYKDKWEINNNIKVEFVDGLKVNGQAVEGNTTAARNTGKNRKVTKSVQNRIDKKKLEIQKIQDKITMQEGGNAEVSDPLDNLKEQLRIAQNELKDLQNPPKAKKDKDISIRIDVNAKNPYATLRAELEHARDLSKGEVPKEEGKHFSRYNGANEGEAAADYTYKKSVGKYNALHPEDVKELPATKEIMSGTVDSGAVASNTTKSSNSASGTVDKKVMQSSSTVDNTIPTKDTITDTVTDTARAVVNEPTAPQPLKAAFEANATPQDLGTGIAKGDIDLSETGNIDNLINHIINMDVEISGKTFKDVANDSESYFNKVVKDDPMKAAAYFNAQSPEILDMIVRQQLAATKLISVLKDAQLSANPRENLRILSAVKGLDKYVEQIGSGFGKGLNYQKVTNKAMDLFGAERFSDLALRGINTLADALDEISLNFTRGKSLKDFKEEIIGMFRKDQATLEAFEEILGDRGLYSKFNEVIEEHYNNLKTGKKVDPAKLVMETLVKDEAESCGWYAKLCDTRDGFVNTIKHWGNQAPSYIINNVLGVASAFKNISSGIIQTNLYPTYKILGGFFTKNGDITREGIDQWLGSMVNLGESMRLAKQAFINGDGLLTNTKDFVEGNLQEGFFKWSTDISSLDEAGITLKNLHSLVPRLMMASDEFMSQLNYRNIVRAKALSQARRETPLLGKFAETADEIFKKKAFNRDGRPLDFQAYTEAKEMLFQVPLDRKMYNPKTGKKEDTGIDKTAMSEIGSWLQNGSQRFVPLRIFMPFIKTPVNIADQALKMNPLLNNPLWQTLSKGKQNEFMSKDPEIRAKAFGKMATMLSLGAGFTLAAANGRITGSAPLDKKEKTALYKTGWQPYSFKLGDKWIPYMGLFTPLDSYMAFCADMTSMVGKALSQEQEQGLDAMAGQILGSILNDYIDQAGFRTNTAKMLDIFNPSTDVRIREQLAANTFSAFLPMAGNVNTIRSTVKTIKGETAKTKPEGFYDNLVRNYTDLFTNTQDFQRDVFGNRVDQYGLIIAKATDDKFMQPEYAEMARMAEKGYTPTVISNQLAKTGVKLTDFKSKENGRSAYDAMFDELSTLKLGGKTLQEAVAELQESERYKTVNDGINTDGKNWNAVPYKTKKKLLDDVFHRYYNMAKRNVIKKRGDEFVNNDGMTMREMQQSKRLEMLNERNNQGLDQNLTNQLRRF